MKDKICLVTGATDGIGKVTAITLARMGATVVGVGRNAQKTAAVTQEIKQATGNQNVDFLVADLRCGRCGRWRPSSSAAILGWMC